MLAPFSNWFCKSIAAVLLFAALHKSLSLYIDDFPFWNQFSIVEICSIVAQIIWVFIECVVVAVLYSHPNPHRRFWIGLLVFTILASVAGFLVYQGEQYCSCFGKVPVFTHWVLAFDLIVASIFAILISSTRTMDDSSVILPRFVRAKYLLAGVIPACMLAIIWLTSQIGLAAQLGFVSRQHSTHPLRKAERTTRFERGIIISEHVV